MAIGISAFVITTIVDIIVMGSYSLKIASSISISQLWFVRRTVLIYKKEMNAQDMPRHIFCVTMISLPTEQRFIKRCPTKCPGSVSLFFEKVVNW